MERMNFFDISRKMNGTFNPPYKIISISRADFDVDFMTKMIFKCKSIKTYSITVKDKTVVALSSDDITVNDYVKWVPIDDNIWLVKKV